MNELLKVWRFLDEEGATEGVGGVTVGAVFIGPESAVADKI